MKNEPVPVERFFRAQREAGRRDGLLEALDRVTSELERTEDPLVRHVLVTIAVELESRL